MVLVFRTVGLPPEYIAMLLPIDWFLDRCRTAVNVMGDVTVSCVLDGKIRDPNVGYIAISQTSVPSTLPLNVE